MRFINQQPQSSYNLKVIKEEPLGRRRRKKMNFTALVYHTIRERFLKTGVTARELSDYFEDNNIEHTFTSVGNTLRILAGITSNRNELLVKKLKKDSKPLIGHHGKITRMFDVNRYYFNPKGTVRVTPIEGRGTWETVNININTVNKLRFITNTKIDIRKF